MPNHSQAEQFDSLYGRIWSAFFKGDADDLTQHERQLLHHIGTDQGLSLGAVAGHLGIPKSSASERVKSLEQRGFLKRLRDSTDERRLSIVLTDAGVARVTQDSILDLVPLAAALRRIPPEDRRALLVGMERLVAGMDGNRTHPGRVIGAPHTVLKTAGP